MITAKDIAEKLAQRAEEVAHYLLPNGKRIGNEWRVGSINGEAGQSLSVHLTGAKAGIWKDFAEGHGGDLLDLWAVKRNLTTSTALKEASHWLGIRLPQFVPYRSPNRFKPVSQRWALAANQSAVTKYLITERKLTRETIALFKIAEQDQTIVFPYWRDDEIVFVKYLKLVRVEGKKHIHVEKDCEPCLFGWHTIPSNARTITLCEGEIDAMSLQQYGFAALSVPFGGGTGDKHKWLEYEFDRLAACDEIYLCFDNDAEGKAAVAELVERLGSHRCKIIELPYKDANACLQAGISKEQMQTFFANALSLDPQELKRASYFVDQVINEFYPANGYEIGIRAPWDKAKDKIVFRPDELSIWTGINGHGKSQLLGHIILHAMSQGARICIASLELKPKRLLLRLTRQAAGLAEPTEDYIRAIHDWYNERLWLFDLVGTAKSQRLLDVFRYARQRYGIDMFVIDSFMKQSVHAYAKRKHLR